ncbi:MAG TPA: hypothetical protein VFO89_06495, partial [Thermoanaerobaculia bacterium]|nr:hypothetical protein [Thermoanaerobaculia bacterium]
GAGSISADGGSMASHVGGGGGAVAIEYVDADPNLLSRVTAFGGFGGRSAGAGSVFLKEAGAAFGSLFIDNAGRGGSGTVLPAFGNGTAAAGTNGNVVATSLTADIPPYFTGHWVEITSTAGTLKGTWRIASISGKSFTLAPNGSETIDVQAGDSYQGVYRFDNVTLRTNTVQSADPIRVTGTLDKGTTNLVVNDGPPSFSAAQSSAAQSNAALPAKGVPASTTVTPRRRSKSLRVSPPLSSSAHPHRTEGPS